MIALIIALLVPVSGAAHTSDLIIDELDRIDQAMMAQFPNTQWYVDSAGRLQDAEAYELDYFEKCWALDWDALPPELEVSVISLCVLYYLD